MLVEIPGPWDGPVRVDSIDESSVVLATLDGHVEAGHIEFRVESAVGGAVEFSIASLARAGMR